MIEKFAVIDNVFPEDVIDEIRADALKRIYYPTNHPDCADMKYLHGIRNGPVDESSGGAWRGYRSHLKGQEARNCEWITHMLDASLEPHNLQCHHWDAHSSFNFWPEDVRYRPNWWHNDANCSWTGILYLNPDIPDFPNESRGGTDLLLNLATQELYRCEPKYNRLFLYRGYLFHKPQIGFGDTIENCRLTFNFCVENIAVSVLRDHGVPQYDDPEILARIGRIADPNEKAATLATLPAFDFDAFQDAPPIEFDGKIVE
jgi:hypothetical protein